MSTASMEWHGRAACTAKDRGLFDQAAKSASALTDAKAICAGCPVRAECLYDALEHEALGGVWGGLTGAERRALPALPADRTAAVVALREILDAGDSDGSSDQEEDAVEVPGPPADEPPSTPAPAPAQPIEEPGTQAPAPAPVTVREDVAELLRQGVTQRQIMTDLRVSARTVTAARKAYGIPYQPGPGFRYTPEQRAENERRAVELLKAGATYDQVSRQVGISQPTIADIRKKHKIPTPVRSGGQARSKDEGLAAYLEPYGDGHTRWTGPTAGRMPQLWADGTRFNARHVVFERHHGRPPLGTVCSNCGEVACMTGAHLTDSAMRAARPTKEEPVTVQALKNLLHEIDQEGGPQAARDNRLTITHERPEPMSTAPELAIAPSELVTIKPPAMETARAPLPVGALLKWAEGHDDKHVRDQAARARTALDELRTRHAADQELAAITSQAEHLEKQLAELRARQAELSPAKKRKQTGSYVRDYDTRTVRAWAKDNGIDCPGVGQIPKRVLDAWRAATSNEPAA